MNLIDKTISIFSPKAAYQRARWRVAEDMLRKYDAASRGRRTSHLPVGDSSANTESAIALSTLRARSRHFGRNNYYASKAFKSMANNTVGTGITPAPSSKSKNRVGQVKTYWKNWAEKTSCDWDGRMNFYGIQKLAMRTIAESGEVLILRRRLTSGKVPIQLQMLEPDFLDESMDTASLPGGGKIVQGVEYDASGKRVAYWLFESHPLEAGFRTSKRRPAKDVLHVFELLRPGQARGIPFISSAMLRLSDFDDFEDAELVKQKTAACFTAFVEDADPAAGGAGTEEDGLERLEPGVIEHLAPGKRITFSNPPSVNSYDTYSRKVLQGIAAGFGLSYEALTGDLSNVNFSSGRMGWLEMQRQIQDWQWNMLIPQLCDAVWQWFIEAVEIANGFSSGDLTVEWTPPRREMIDPVKETEAITMQVRSGLCSWPEAIRAQGYEPEAVIAEIKQANEWFDANGIKLDSDGRNPAKGPSGNQQQVQQNETE